MDTLPLISCVMPTRNRPELAARAIKLFLAQDYPNKELVIVDNGEAFLSPQLTDHPEIVYIVINHEETGSFGQLRNFTNHLAKGEVIAHWDDDDWYAPDRLSEKWRLLSEGADVCGVSTVYFFAPEYKLAWSFTWRGSFPWLACSSLMYRSSRWASRPFPNVNHGESTQWLISQLSEQQKPILSHADSRLYAARIHSGNMSPKVTKGRDWRRIPYFSLPWGAISDD